MTVVRIIGACVVIGVFLFTGLAGLAYVVSSIRWKRGTR